MARASTSRSSTITSCRSARRRWSGEGRDVTLVSYSIGVGVALEAAGKLAEEGIEAEVIDLRTLRPLDKATVLASLAKTNRMVCVEEGWPACSISSELIAVAMEEGFDDLDAPVLRVTDEDVPLPYAANLEKLALIKVDDVVAAAKKVLLPLSRAPSTPTAASRSPTCRRRRAPGPRGALAS